MKALERENRERPQVNKILRICEPLKAPRVRALWRQRILRWQRCTAGRSNGGFIVPSVAPTGGRRSACVLPSAASTLMIIWPCGLIQPGCRIGRAALYPEILRVFEENLWVFGGRKILQQLGREGFEVARGIVTRRMKYIDFERVSLAKPNWTTISDKKAPCPADKMNREFHLPAPTCSGSATSHMSLRGKGSFMLYSSSTPISAASSLAGQHVGVSVSMLWNRPFMSAAPQRPWALSIIATGPANMCR